MKPSEPVARQSKVIPTWARWPCDLGDPGSDYEAGTCPPPPPAQGLRGPSEDGPVGEVPMAWLHVLGHHSLRRRKAFCQPVPVTLQSSGDGETTKHYEFLQEERLGVPGHLQALVTWGAKAKEKKLNFLAVCTPATVLERE